jgi:hypothetical protein
MKKMVYLAISGGLLMQPAMADDVSAIVWLPHGVLSGNKLFESLLTTYWQREKEVNELDEPNFTEVLKTPGSALTAKQVRELAEQVWPEISM